MINLLLAVLFTVGLYLTLASLYDIKESQNCEIKSPHPISPRIEIHIKSDGSRDTTYIYKEVK
jgi:hypothetical protein